MKFLPEAVSTEPVDQDWTVRFFDYCQDVSDQQMQSLWAKLLSGEVAKPGSFSQRTLSIVRDMRRQDAIAFTKLATFFWTATDEGMHIFPMLRTFEPDSRRHVGLEFVELLQLNALNLIHHDTGQSFRLAVANPGTISYYGSTFTVIDKRGPGSCVIEIGECLLTQAGTELAPLAGGQPDNEYRDRVIQILQQHSLEISARP